MPSRSGQPVAAGLHIYLLVAFLAILRLSHALQYVANSPCESVCSDQNSGTLQEDAVCLDASYQDTTNGKNFQKCVGCLLNSTAVDSSNGETDVQWGLFNLRYTLASCMFGIPQERVSISSPCQVTCQPLNRSIAYQLSNNTSTTNPNYAFCTNGQFDDTTINNCAFCYSLIPQQLFLANFLQALHIVCRQTPTSGASFFPDAQSIFNETLISGPAPPKVAGSGGGGLHGTSLALAIALPIVGGILLIGCGCWGCWGFTRRRRKRMAATGRMSRVHNAQVDGAMYSPVSGRMMWGENEPPQEMVKLSPNVAHGQHPSPGLMQTRYSPHYPPGSAIGGGQDEQITPLRTSFQREDVGPGADQVQDPNLHEQYFGIADGGSDVAGPSHHTGLGVYNDRHSTTHTRDDERGHWVQ